MFKQVKAALESLNLTNTYFQGFLDNHLDDDAIRCCLDSADLQPMLKDVVPSTGHRIKFLKNFRAIVNGRPCTSSQSSTSNPKIVEKVTRWSSFDGDLQYVTDVFSPVKPPQEGPMQVQIIDVQPGPNGGLPRIQLFEDEFQRIVEKSGSRQIAVITIAGPSNKGKSVFLNFLLRYLRAKKEGIVDWMGWLEPCQSLKGVSRRNGDVVTKGIWIWSEPIPYRANGQDVDVYLMETQGVYDESLGQREWSILVGLSLLTSSCFIFNIAQVLQEDCLQLFKNFLSFGLYALERDGSNENLKPFQKLLFLIRDWGKFNGYPYGGEGGQKYIEQKLECKKTHPEDAKIIRQQMKACFEDISCHLFPHPGEEARDVNFNGAVNATTKFREFVDKVQGCVESLMNEDNLPVKKLHGNLLTGGDLLALFKSYTTLLNAEESPSSETLYKVSIQSCNATVVGQCVDAFTAEVESALSDHGCMDEEDLEVKLMEAEKIALMLFSRMRKLGDSKIIDDARTKITSRIMGKCEMYRRENKIKNFEVESKVDEELRRITQAFNASMESKLVGSAVTSQTLQSVHSEAFSRAKLALLDTIKPLKLRPNVAEAALKTLKDSTDVNAWKGKLKDSNEPIQTEVGKVMSIAQNNYREAMSPNHFTNVHEFLKTEAIFRNSCLAELRSSTTLLSKISQAAYEDKLNTKLEAIRDHYLHQLHKIEGDSKGKMNLCYGNCTQVYNSCMDKMLIHSGKNPVSNEKLDTYHRESVSAAVKYIRELSFFNQLNDPTAARTDAESKLIMLLGKKFGEYQQMNKRKLDNFALSDLKKFSTPAQTEQSLGKLSVGMYFGPDVVQFGQYSSDVNTFNQSCVEILPFISFKDEKILIGDKAKNCSARKYNVFDIISRPTDALLRKCVKLYAKNFNLTGNEIAVLFFHEAKKQFEALVKTQVETCAVAASGLLPSASKQGLTSALIMSGFSRVMFIPSTTAILVWYLNWRNSQSSLKKQKQPKVLVIHHAGPLVEVVKAEINAPQNIKIRKLGGFLNNNDFKEAQGTKAVQSAIREAITEVKELSRDFEEVIVTFGKCDAITREAMTKIVSDMFNTVHYEEKSRRPILFSAAAYNANHNGDKSVRAHWPLFPTFNYNHLHPYKLSIRTSSKTVVLAFPTSGSERHSVHFPRGESLFEVVERNKNGKMWCYSFYFDPKVICSSQQVVCDVTLSNNCTFLIAGAPLTCETFKFISVFDLEYTKTRVAEVVLEEQRSMGRRTSSSSVPEDSKKY